MVPFCILPHCREAMGSGILHFSTTLRGGQWVAVSFGTLPDCRGAAGSGILQCSGQWAVVSFSTLPQCRG